VELSGIGDSKDNIYMMGREPRIQELQILKNISTYPIEPIHHVGMRIYLSKKSYGDE
jgi:hypothetical protein